MGGKIIIVLFCVFLLGLVIYAVNSNIVGKLGSPFGSLFHYSSSTWAITASVDYFRPAPGGDLADDIARLRRTSVLAHDDDKSGGDTGRFTLAELSPYFKKITFGGVSAGSLYSYGTIVLSSYGLAASDTVDITGWQIKTNRGGEYIPQAIDLYDPRDLRRRAISWSAKTNMFIFILPRGRSICVLMNASAISGTRINLRRRCRTDCPYIDQSAISKMGFTGACENYIYSLGSCRRPT